ncbi:phosphatase PAP2 family protein [Shewanella sp. YIC-542]|uniref:phosphatase PAP2 family protein n=1 Tax=Shewanella mytili TaxID=3377111 RepID=UPI00398F5B2A
MKIDLQLTQWIFQWESNATTWSLRHNFFFEEVLHNGGRHLVTLLALILLCAIIASFSKPSLAHWRKDLLLLFVNVALSILLVRFAKEYSNVSCPWDLLQFGGNKPWVPFPDSLFSPLSLGQCFPGGHSSGGFAWVALYYFARQQLPQRRFQLLAFALVLGGVFAFCQELRGAHFLSHDLSSLLISWVVATLGYGLAYRPWQQKALAAPLAASQAMRV